MKKAAHVTTTALLLLSLTLGACGKNTTAREAGLISGKNFGVSSNGLTSAPVSEATKKANLEAWQKLVLSDEKNIALAELLSSVVAKESQSEIKDLVMSLSDTEIEFIISQVKDERDALSRSYLFRQNIGLEGSALYQKSILFADYVADSEAEQMTIATFSYLKSKSLEEIYQSFNKIIDDNSKDIAQAMMMEIGKNNPELAKEIEASAMKARSVEEFSKKLKGSRKYLDQADEFLKSSGLNTQEQLMLIATGAVGAVIFAEVKESKTFVVIMEKYKEVKIIIEEVNEKVKQVKVAVEVITQSREKMEAAYVSLNLGLQTVGEEIKDTYNNVKNSDSPDAKRMATMLYDNVVKGKKVPDNADASVIASQKRIIEGMNLSFQAAGVMADSLSDIISTTRNLSAALGIKLPKGLDKALNTASKVAAGVKLASTIVAGFASGGVLAAVGMLSSGPIGSMLGLGGGPDPAVMAALGRIEAKLDVVLENQKKMMEMQMETINMIKNVAVMIDEYHRKEMNALASLHDDVMLVNEIGKAKLNENIRACESMIEFELAQYWRDYERSVFTGSTTIEFDFDKFYSNLKTMNDFRRFARGVAGDDYLSCQRGLASAFGSITSSGNPILGVYNSSEDRNIFAFQRDVYTPLVSIYSAMAKESGEQKKILHIPVASVGSLDLKNEYLTSRAGTFSNAGYKFGYSLSKMISPMSLERYFSSLSILYPIFEFNEREWDLTLPELVDTYFRMTSNQNGKVSRGYFFMSNALDLIQSAIAQEAMLAGETVIPVIRKNLSKDIFTTGSCANSQVCAVRSNKLLMKNYLNYVVTKNLYSMESNALTYKNALESGNITALAKFLDISNDQLAVLKVDGQKVVSVSLKGTRDQEYSVQLPTLEMIKEGKMIYSENMPRLLKMQQEAISSLVKLSPSQFRTIENRVGLANLLLLKEF